MVARPRRRLTLQDVAAELGVSAKTVSNAYSRPDQLSDELRSRVLATAARLGYAGPDPLAAGLRRGRVGAIGFIYDNPLSYAFNDPVTGSLLGGISGVAEDAGAGLLLLPGSADPVRRAAAVTGAVVDGVVVCSVADDDPLLQMVIARRLPLAVVDQPDPDRLAALGAETAPWVGIDDYTAASVAAAHLLDLGHRRLGVVSFGLNRADLAGFADPEVQAAAGYAVTRRRLAGYRETDARYGVDWSTVPVWQGTDSTPEEGAAGAAAILARDPRPTALLCLSDRLAEGALRVAAVLGLDVPGALSVVGFDDAQDRADTRMLTTIAQPSRVKGEHAARVLLDLLAQRPSVSRRVLSTELVIRSSTSPPASRTP